MASFKSNYSLLTTDRVRELLIYEASTGTFRWRVDRANGRIPAGSRAGSVTAGGYIEIYIDGLRCLGHRIAVLYIAGRWPPYQVDHIDRDRSNNAWRNLREATNEQNQANKAARSDNRIGFKGVKRCRGMYQARIRIAGVDRHLGTFATPEEASATYRRAAELSFGEFARIA